MRPPSQVVLAGTSARCCTRCPGIMRGLPKGSRIPIICMYVYIYICMHIRMSKNMYVQRFRVRMCIHIYIYTHTHAHVYIYIYTHVCVYIYIYISIYIYVCMRQACIWVSGTIPKGAHVPKYKVLKVSMPGI